MTLPINPIGQRNPQWAGKQLGTVQGRTIGSDGCTITSATMLHNYYYRATPITPGELNKTFTSQHLYSNGDLFVGSNFVKLFPAIRFEGISYYPDPIPADMAKIKSHLDKGHPIFVWLYNQGVFHCTLAVGYERDDRGVDQIIVNDPWQGDQVRIDKRWGDSATVILEADYYSGSVLEEIPSTRCLDAVAVTGKHLLFLGVETRTWTHQQFIDAAKFARSHGVDSLLVKFAEGTIVWYGGIDGFRHIRDAIKQQGVGVIPYMYSYGDRFGGLDGELNLLAEYMQDNGVVCADMEVEWNGQMEWASRMNARLQPIPGVFLVSTWGDPFLQNWGGVIEALNPCVKAYMPQQYTNFLASCWQQFAQSGAACLQPTVDLSQEFGLNDPVAIAKAAYNQGHTALSVWHYGLAVKKPSLLDAVFHAFPKGETPMPQSPANPYDTNAHIRQELDTCWKSTAHLFGGTPAPMNTGIHDSWVKAWLFHNYQFGPPITQEYKSIDSDGNPLTVQECAHARCEWDKYGIPHWFTANGPVKF